LVKHRAKIQQQLSTFSGVAKIPKGKGVIELILPNDLLNMMDLEHGSELAYYINEHKELVLSKMQESDIYNI
jgi:hypothetical protein